MSRTIVIAFATCAAAALSGAQTPRPSMPDPYDFADRAGFKAIFDGSSLAEWDGDRGVWRAEQGAMVGESTLEKPLTANTFIIWRGGEPQDFELKAEYRMNAGNSGIQYRSAEMREAGRWVLRGYQADLDFDNRWTGQLYEERGRGFLALRGQSTHIGEGGKPRVVGRLESGDALKALVRVNDWNAFHVVARGHMLMHIINGHVMSIAIDDDARQRAVRGLIGFQMHTGPPMKVEFRNVWLKTMDVDAPRAIK
jgi:hypothetical protein